MFLSIAFFNTSDFCSGGCVGWVFKSWETDGLSVCFCAVFRSSNGFISVWVPVMVFLSGWDSTFGLTWGFISVVCFSQISVECYEIKSKLNLFHRKNRDNSFIGRVFKFQPWIFLALRIQKNWKKEKNYGDEKKQASLY